ncbi:cytochrome P450 76A2-like [Magnolia sinica]|uniref:cytochrome P450 76A2-like n=1 Tax=Magnolia sinica TaxID=86752 RepID=UPI00265919F6|nr:cytochrome P450 76A2-like [Magnolia sinica]
MEKVSSFLLWSSILLPAALIFLLVRKKRKNVGIRSRPRPPGPRGWPVVGNMFDLGSVPHLTLAALRQKHGPVVSLQFGSMKTVVVLSAEAATELFKNHDLSFAGRTITEAMRGCSFNESSMALGQYGPYWRALRRICTTELFINRRLNETVSIRNKCVDDMLRWIAEEAEEKGSVEVIRFAFLAVFNLVSNLMLSRDLLDPQSKEGAEFFRLNSTMAGLSGKPNVADFFPSLRWLDPQGIRKKMDECVGRALEIASGFVEDHIQNQSLGEEIGKKDFLDVLLEFRGEVKERVEISDRDLKVLILEIFLAATDTTTSTIEWAMAELLRNPGLMSKVQAELDQVVGRGIKIEEKHMEGLPYLNAVIKETLRLHPPLPFLIPRRAVEDTEYMGYSIVKDTQVLVHAWAIGRDPSWDDPLSFKPERFLHSDIDYRGHHFQLIPFGAGRRMCAGLPLADRMLHLLLGSLLHCFDWTLDGNVMPETLDMEERMGITLHKAIPLKAIPKPRMA